DRGAPASDGPRERRGVVGLARARAAHARRLLDRSSAEEGRGGVPRTRVRLDGGAGLGGTSGTQTLRTRASRARRAAGGVCRRRVGADREVGRGGGRFRAVVARVRRGGRASAGGPGKGDGRAYGSRR